MTSLDTIRKDEKVRANLRDVERFAEIKYMVCRSNNLIHSERLLMMHEDFLPVIKEVYPEYREDYARAYLFLHDLHEIISTDVPTPEKMKMSVEEMQHLENIEYRACDEMAGVLPITVNGYNTRDMMYDAITKFTLEAQVCSFLDKRDGHCDATNEIRLGNLSFMEPAKRYCGIMRVLPDYFGLKKLERLYESGKEHPFLDLSPGSDKRLRELANEGQGTLIEDLSQPVGIPAYDRWTELHKSTGRLEYFKGAEMRLEAKVVGFND